MISNLPVSSQQFLASLSQLQTRTNRAEEELSSGYKVQSASDAPDQIGQLLQLESQLSSTTQTGTNLTNVKAEVDSGESALNSAVQYLENATTLAAQGASSITTAAARAGFATQVKAIQQQLVAIAGTTVQGRYIFGGDADTQLPYQLNPAGPNGVDRLTNVSASRQIADSRGISFPVSETAQTIFDHRNADDSLASDNVFAALNSLQTALTNNDTAGISSALDSLHTAANYLNTQLSFYGAAQDRVNRALEDQQNRITDLKTQISNIRDADITEVSLELNAGTVQQQASLAGEAKLSQKTLFDYLG